MSSKYYYYWQQILQLQFSSFKKVKYPKIITQSFSYEKLKTYGP
jgi:hypothetical protein